MKRFIAPKRITVCNKENNALDININPIKHSLVQPKKDSHENWEVYQVLFTTDIKRKRKRFRDAYLLITEKHAKLFDTEGKLLQQQNKALSKKTFEALKVGSVLLTYNKHIEISSRIDTEEYLSGKIFTSSRLCSQQKLVNIEKGQPFQRVSTSTQATTKNARKMNDKKALFLFSMNGNDTYVDGFLAKHLRPHQQEGIKFMFECLIARGNLSEGCILADDMGLGKTLQSLCLLWTMLTKGPTTQSKWCRKAIVVTPATLVQNWSQEIIKWIGTHRLDPVVISKSGKEAAEKVNLFKQSKLKRCILISYELYRKHSVVLNGMRDVDLLICDEGHRLKAAKGNKTIDALKNIQTKRKIILTGTPLQNNLSEFYALVNFVCPTSFNMDHKKFKRIFQMPIEKGTDKLASYQERLIAKRRSDQINEITEGFILRRTSEVNSRFLPPRTDVTLFLGLTTLQEQYYQAVIYTMFGLQNIRNVSNEVGQIIHEKCTDIKGSTACSLQLITLLRKICLNPLLLMGEPLGLDTATSMSNKLMVLFRILNTLHSKNETSKIVVVSNSSLVLQHLEIYLIQLNYKLFKLDGSTPQKNRQDIVDQFNYSKEPCVSIFLLSSKAGGCGINLIGASRLIMLDPDWNPATDKQALARIWRDGQTNPVYIYRFIAAGTIEEKILQRQEMKLNSAENLMNKQTNFSKYSRKELAKLFSYKKPLSAQVNLAELQDFSVRVSLEANKKDLISWSINKTN